MFFQFLSRSLGVLMLAGAMMSPPGAQAQAQAPTLTSAIMDANWNDSNWLYSNASPDYNIAVLTPLAQNNVIMAQWFLADALARQGRDLEATTWLYSASLATRMDASICRQKEASTIEYRFLQTFSPQFARLRAHEKNRTQALRSAIRFHGERLQSSNQPAWVCRLVTLEVKRPPSKKPRIIKIALAKQDSWVELRTRVFDEYKKQTGLDFTRSPDALLITPVTQPNPTRP